MNVLVSKCAESSKEFSKELYTAVKQGLKIIPEDALPYHLENEYKGVMFAVYIRTDKDNLVLLVDKGKIAVTSYANSVVLNGGLYPTVLSDLGMVCAKDLLEKVFAVKNVEALQRLITHSTCFPVGAVETSKKYVIVFNIVLSVDLLRDPEIVLREGFLFNPIETYKPEDSLQKSIAESLVIVK